MYYVKSRMSWKTSIVFTIIQKHDIISFEIKEIGMILSFKRETGENPVQLPLL